MQESQKHSFAGILTQAEYVHEANQSDEERRKGQYQAAYARCQRLLARIESQPKGSPRGPGSFEHTATLGRLGRCLLAIGNFSGAEQLFRKAIALSEVLVQHDPENRDLLREQAGHLAELGEALDHQGQYAQAEKAYEQALQIDEHFGDLRNQAISRSQLGLIAFEQGKYLEARWHYQRALETFHALGEKGPEAVVWHRLGWVAQEEQNWPEAERCYRKSLSLREQLGDRVGAAQTRDHLGQVARLTGRFDEAKGWYLSAVALSKQADETSGDHAEHLFNLARFLILEVQAGGRQEASHQLEEARRYLEQALAIQQVLRSPGIWKTFSLLADIAEMQGRREAADVYRRQERDGFVSSASNRYWIDHSFGRLFPILARALKDLEVRAQTKELLSQFEADGWHISEALQRIWAGERNWQTLAQNLDNNEALFVLRVLETL